MTALVFPLAAFVALSVLAVGWLQVWHRLSWKNLALFMLGALVGIFCVFVVVAWRGFGCGGPPPPPPTFVERLMPLVLLLSASSVGGLVVVWLGGSTADQGVRDEGTGFTP